MYISSPDLSLELQNHVLDGLFNTSPWLPNGHLKPNMLKIELLTVSTPPPHLLFPRLTNLNKRHRYTQPSGQNQRGLFNFSLFLEHTSNPLQVLWLYFLITSTAAVTSHEQLLTRSCLDCSNSLLTVLFHSYTLQLSLHTAMSGFVSFGVRKMF